MKAKYLTPLFATLIYFGGLKTIDAQSATPQTSTPQNIEIKSELIQADNFKLSLDDLAKELSEKSYAPNNDSTLWIGTNHNGDSCNYNFDRKKRFLGSDSYVNNNPSTPRRKMQIHFNHDGNISEIILTEGEKWKTTKPVLFEVYGKKTGEDNILLHKFKYNKQSNFTEWTCTDNHKNLEFEVKINYDKQGRLIQEKKIDKYSTVEKTISYDYSNQNIIKTINEYDETTRFKYDKSTDSWIPLEAKSKTE